MLDFAALRAPSRFLALLLILLASSAWQPASAQKKGGMEEFEEVDPYTKGDRELELALGYARVGFFPWRSGEDTLTVQENIGGIPMIWVETEHFRIGSSLGSYTLCNDKLEKARLKKEIKRLEGKIGRMKLVSKKKLDPWLRMHLYAQMVEDLYAKFMEDFKLDKTKFPPNRMHLGHKDKFLLLMCQKNSEFGRYLKTYENSEATSFFRTGWMDEGMIVAASIEGTNKDWSSEKSAPTDTMFRCMVAASITTNFVDGYNDNQFRAPRWLAFGMAHLYLKSLDERWPRFDGRTVVYDMNNDSWDWEPRVYKLVKNDFYADCKKMFSFLEYTDLNERDHLVCWSKLKFAMEVLKVDLNGFLKATCPRAMGDIRPTAAESIAMQTKAFADHFDITPEEFDKQWAKHVLKKYRKK